MELERAPADGDPDDELGARVSTARPEIDPFLTRVIAASAARAVLGVDREVRVGRYALRRVLGAGGGGSVYVARDPELDRELAIKLIAAPDPVRRARALNEGQALARLAHPNVVTVFDVGVVEDRVYLAMELVRGRSLRAVDPATPRDVIRAYRQAGEGLAAAHKIGLVHGDFKPENAVIGADGRVRVVDFGLAGAVGADIAGGTPRYMAPEVARGGAAAPAIDQYAFAVSLRESLEAGGMRPLPRWLASIVNRGSADDPAARYPTLDEMLAALARDPRTRWQRRAIVIAPVAVAALAFWLGRERAGSAGPSCDGGAEALAPVWSGPRAASVHAHVAGLDTPFAAVAADSGRDALAAYGRGWVDAYDAACRDATRGPSSKLADRRAACLGQARNQLAATVDILASADVAQLAGALRAVQELPDLGRCADPAALMIDVEPPTPAQAPRVARVVEDLDRARAAVEAATPDAPTLTAGVVEAARELAYRPLVAVALLAHGRALLAHDRPQAAIAPLTEAVDLAIPARDDATAVEAYARLLLALPSESNDVALAGARPVLGLAARLGPRDQFPVALIHNHVGVVELAAGHADAARTTWTHALELARGVDGPGAVELAWVRSNLALVTDDPLARMRLHEEALAIVRERLGADHPLTLDLELASAFAQPDVAVSRQRMRAPCARFAAVHPDRGGRVVDCAYELAILDLAAGAEAEAAMSFDLALDPDLRGELDASRLEIARSYQALLAGDLVAASAGFAALARRLRPTDATRWFELPLVADVELGLAACARAQGEHAAARAATARAITYLERAAASRALPVITRRLAWARRL